MNKQRAQRNRGALTAERVAALEAIPGWSWAPLDEDFQCGLLELRAFTKREDHARVPAKYTTKSGFKLGIWVRRRRLSHTRGILAPERIAALEAIPRWSWDPFDDDFQGGLRELRAFAKREGHARVPAKSAMKSGFRLGRWVRNRRFERLAGTLSPERATSLEAVPGWSWSPFDDTYQRGLDEMRAFSDREGHARVPMGYVTKAGFPLGSWAGSRRYDYKQGRLAPERVSDLEALPDWTFRPPRGPKGPRTNAWSRREGETVYGGIVRSAKRQVVASTARRLRASRS